MCQHWVLNCVLKGFRHVIFEGANLWVSGGNVPQTQPCRHTWTHSKSVWYDWSLTLGNYAPEMPKKTLEAWRRCVHARSSCCWCCCRCRWLLLDVDVVHFDFTAAYLLHLRTCDIYRLGPLLTAIIKNNKYSSVRRLIVFAVVTSPLWARDGSIYRWYLADIDISVSYRHFRYRFLSASLYVSKRGAYWDRLCRDVVGRWLVGRWLSRACTVAKRCILGL